MIQGGGQDFLLNGRAQIKHGVVVVKESTGSHLEPPSQELVLHLQEVAFVGLGLERLVDDGELRVVLNVLPPGITMADAGG